MKPTNAERRVEIVSRMSEAAGRHAAKWKELGAPMIESLNGGQWPRVIAVGPAVRGGLKFSYGENNGHTGKPGKVFEVTCRKDGTLDNAGLGSVYYGVKHLGIKRMELWGTDLSTQEKTLKQIRAANIEGFGQVDVREGATNGARGNGLKDAEAVVLCCSDSRVQAYQIFEGNEIVVVSNAGNHISPVAMEAMEEMIGKGVPVIMILGHTKCGAVGAAAKENNEPLLSETLSVIRENQKYTFSSGTPEAQSAIVSGRILMGEYFATYYGQALHEVQDLIRQSETTVMASLLDLSTGEVAALKMD